MTEIERRNKGYLLKKGTKMAAKKKTQPGTILEGQQSWIRDLKHMPQN